MTPQPQHPQRCETCRDLLTCKPGEILYAATRRKGCASHSSAGAQQRIEHTGKLYIEVDHGKVKCTDGKYHDFQEYFYLFDVAVGDTIALLQAGDQHE